MVTYELKVNGRECTVQAEPATTLLSVLRENLHLTAAKPGCGEGQCGACTVLVGGKAVHSCITSVPQIDSQPILTIEGATPGSKLQQIQASFLKHSAFQCGYCTPGMIMASAALLDRIPHPTTRQIRAELNGNLCRCGTYTRIIASILDASRRGEHA